jgi:hypothetical protein
MPETFARAGKGDSKNGKDRAARAEAEVITVTAFSARSTSRRLFTLMALRSKSRTLSRLIATESVRTYIPQRRKIGGDYIVAHRNGKTHRTGEHCEIYEEHADTSKKDSSQ